MKATIRAIYQKGVLKPVDSIDLKENEVVNLTVEDTGENCPDVSRKPARPEDNYQGLASLFSEEDLKEMEAALHDFRQVDPDGW